MGVYLVPFELDRLDEMGEGTGFARVNTALVDAGVPGLGGITGEGDGFEEKLIADISSFSRLVEDLAPQTERVRPPIAPGASPHVFPAAVADLWLPIEFSGLLVVPGVTGIYQEQLTIASSVDIVRQHEAIAKVIDFPLASVPQLHPHGYVINDWHEEMERSEDPNDPEWLRDPDIAFYLALFWSVAKYSLDNHEPVAYT
jgi:hypothetical protein